MPKKKNQKKTRQVYLWLNCSCQRTEDLHYGCQNVSHITWKYSPTVHVVYLLSACVDIMMFVFRFELPFFLFFFLSVFFFSSYLSLSL